MSFNCFNVLAVYLLKKKTFFQNHKLLSNYSWEFSEFHNAEFSLRSQSWPVSWTQPQLRGTIVIIWPSSVKCHSASIIRKSLTRPSRFHTLTPSLITAVSPDYSGGALCLFILSWAELSCRGRGGGWVWWGGVRGLWNGYTSGEAVYTSREATQKKTHDFLWRWTQRLHLLISERLQKATVTDFSLSGLFTLCA